MIKVLWLSNRTLSDKKSFATGTWVHSMAVALVDAGTIQLYNIAQARVKDTTRQDFKSICQWLIPYESLKGNGLPSSKAILKIQRIVNDIKPDIIHVWGTEHFWGLLTARGYLKGNIILEIQGLKFVIAKHFYSGLTLIDLIKCIGVKEIIKPSLSLFGENYSFKKWGKFEIEMLINHKNISTQSDWVRAHVKNLNPSAHIYNTSRTLRSEFADADRWDIANCVSYQVFTSTSAIDSYKGLHILIHAIAILKNRYPEIKLCIAGNVKSGLREEGYSKWLKRKIKSLGIKENISWLGSLDAKNLVLQMHKANVVVVPSFIESHCNALNEALTVGVPTVASFAGAMPELAIHEKTALFFPPGDVTMCANAIEKFFLNIEYASAVSQNAYNIKKTKSNKDIAEIQFEIYSRFLQNINEVK